MPKLITSNPHPSNIDATRFLPISCKSPFTVPIIILAIGRLWLPANCGFNNSKDPFMARAAINNSGTKALPASKRLPISSIALTMYSLITYCGSTFSSIASFVIATATGNFPVRIAVYKSFKFAILILVFLVIFIKCIIE